MNKVIIKGRLVTDAMLTPLNETHEMAQFTLAVPTASYKPDSQGRLVRTNTVEMMSCVLWEKPGDDNGLIARMMEGREVQVEGSLVGVEQVDQYGLIHHARYVEVETLALISEDLVSLAA